MADAPSRWLKDSARLPVLDGGGPRGGWFAEGLTRHEYHCHRVRRVVASFRTAYQQCVLADLASFGRTLILDGEVQSTELDEYIYHEALVHPALLMHRGPRRVLIMGGGEGATVREALKHPSIEQLVMADIDSEVMDLCLRHLPAWHRGSFDDPRVRLLIEDARQVIRNAKEPFDVILSDLPSAIRGGPAYKLYTLEFYRGLKRRLGPGGVFALQAGSGQMLQWEFHRALHRTLRRVFRVVRPYYAFIPGYAVPWAFLLCADRSAGDPRRWTPARIDRALARRRIRDLRFLDGEAMAGLFHVPKNVRTALAAERRVISDRNPVYFFV